MTKREMSDYLTDVNISIQFVIDAIDIAWGDAQEIAEEWRHGSLLALGIEELRRCVDKIHHLQYEHLTESKNNA